MPILQIRDENGKFIPINAIRGDNGKSAYEQAKEGGYNGTEAEFIALLNGLTNSEDAAHYSDFNNPHRVTAVQTGAIPEIYSPTPDLDAVIASGGGKMLVHCYNEFTSNTPYTYGMTACTHGVVITDAFTSEYGTQLCMPSGEDSVFVRRLNGGGISLWVRLAKDADLESHIFNNLSHVQTNGLGGASMGGGAITDVHAIQLGEGTNNNPYTLQVYDYQLLNDFGKIPTDRLPFASGSYKGTNTCGISKPNTLTFDFVPKFVIVSQRGERNATGGGCFIWISQGSTLSFINNGSNYWVHPTLSDKTLSWYCAESASYQLNSSNYEYDYFAWG